MWLRKIIKEGFFINSFAIKCGFIGALVMVGLMLLTVVDVFLRYFFNSPILGGFELTEIALVVMVFLAIPLTSAKKANVRVDLLVQRLPVRVRAIFDAVTCLMSLLITALLTYYTIPQAFYIRSLNIHSDMLDIPIFPFYLVVSFGFFLLFFILVINLIDFIKEAIKG